MHLYFITRGKRRNVRNFIELIEDQYLEYEYEKEKKGIVQLIPREIKLWEMVFPEHKKDDVLAMMGQEGYDQYGFMKKLKNVLAKIFGLKKLPKKINSNYSKIPSVNVGKHFIGLKKDKFVNGIEQL